MLVSSAISRINYVLRGTDDDAPGVSTPEWLYWVDTLNRVKDGLYEDVAKNWDFSWHETAPNEPGTGATTGTTTLTGTGTNFLDYRVGDKITVSGETVRTIATITSDTVLTVTAAFSNTASTLSFTHTSIIDEDTESYNLHRRFLGASDHIVITKTDGNEVYVQLTKPPGRSTGTRNAYIHDENPQVLTFSTDIESTESIVGGQLSIPGYYNAPDMTAETDVLPFPDPNFAVLQVAHEIAFNDITYEDKSGDLLAKANYLHRQMVKKNRRGTYGRPSRVPRNNYRIGSSGYR